MGSINVKMHIVPKNYNATPRRIMTLAKHITDHLNAQKDYRMVTSKQNNVVFANTRVSDVIDALESFVDLIKYRR